MSPGDRVERAWLILACSARKRHDPGLLPAVERYCGPAFLVLRKWQREHPESAAALEVLILSAEFGLIEAATLIPDYDRRMTGARARELGPQVEAALVAHELTGSAPVCVHAGADYRPALGAWLDEVGQQADITQTHGGQGEQLAQLKGWLDGLAAPGGTAARAGIAGGPAHVGIAGNLSPDNRTATLQVQSRFGVAGLNDAKIVAAGRGAVVGVAGLDSRGVATTATRALYGISGLDRTAKVAIAGINTRPVVEASRGAVGLETGAHAETLAHVGQLAERDQALGAISRDSQRLGDRAAREAWQRALWFSDFSYIVKQAPGNRVQWREGREVVFGRPYRQLPLGLDSAGFRRCLTRTAPRWTNIPSCYVAAIELIDPDCYAAYDYPENREETLRSLRDLMAMFPSDITNGRMWPIFSVRWTYRDDAHLDFARLPGWAGRNLAALIPVTRTQRLFTDATRELWARQAIANALILAKDPDFRWMAETFGQVMIGGMVKCKLARMARHIFAAVLAHVMPGVHFWLLGQASFAVINGLGTLGLLDRISTDGTWWVSESACDRTSVLENGLITMLSLGLPRTKDGAHRYGRQSFFTTTELMAGNLRSLLSAYQGLWTWPPPEPLPLDLFDLDQATELRQRLQMAQLELGSLLPQAAGS